MKLESKSAQVALHWITQLLRQQSIPYQIEGGLAAKAYGVSRPLNDIDLAVPNLALVHIAKWTNPYITFGPARWQDETWDLMLLTLEYEGQSIDIVGADDGQLFNKRTQQWQKCPAHLDTAVLKNIDGQLLPIIAKTDLIAYKILLQREVDVVDLAGLQNIPA